MARALLRIAKEQTAVPPDGAVRLGRLTGLDSTGRPLVIAEGDEAPRVARVGVPGPCPTDEAVRDGVPVVLMFEHGDVPPVIVGIVRDRFEPPASTSVALVSPETKTVSLNGSAVIVQGDDEIVLRCGQGSLTIRANGQIVIKGTRLVSRASETNKIRGAAVHIN